MNHKLTQFLLLKLAEECNEVAQRALKAAQFGMDEREPGQLATNEQRLMDEYRDIMSMVAMLQTQGYMLNLKRADDVLAHYMGRRARLAKFARYSSNLGMLDSSVADELEALARGLGFSDDARTPAREPRFNGQEFTHVIVDELNLDRRDT